MANPFEILVMNLNAMGFFGFLLPFLLVFVIIFAILLKSNTLGDNKNIIGVLSLVVAFFVVGYGGPALGYFFVNLFGMAAIILGGILVIVLFLAMTGGDIGKLLEGKAAMAMVAAIGLIVFFLALGGITGIAISESTLALIFVIIFMAIAIYFIARK
jgi:hypothetical protein